MYFPNCSVLAIPVANPNPNSNFPVDSSSFPSTLALSDLVSMAGNLPSAVSLDFPAADYESPPTPRRSSRPVLTPRSARAPPRRRSLDHKPDRGKRSRTARLGPRPRRSRAREASNPRARPRVKVPEVRGTTRRRRPRKRRVSAGKSRRTRHNAGPLRVRGGSLLGLRAA